MDKKERYPSELWIEMTEIRETGAYWRRTGWKLVAKKRRQRDARAPWSFPTEEQTDHHERITRNGRGEDPKYVEFGQCDFQLFGEWNLRSITQWLQESFTLIVELWSFICQNLHSKSSKFGCSPKMPIAHLQYLGASQRCFVSCHPITFRQNWFRKASNGSTQTKHP